MSKHASKNIRHAPFILKADIAQCFPSLYTHSIAWAAHGINSSKADTDRDSNSNYFNALDFFVRNGQRGNTRGVLVGPDAYRLIAEFILSRIDHELSSLVGDKVVGAVRHVDDYYIGLKTEHDAESVLSTLRELLATYELNLNDQKTKIYSSLEPINDLWAQRLRRSVRLNRYGISHDEVEVAIAEAVDTCKNLSSESPIKILLRSFDESKIYSSSHWEFVEHNLQRIAQKHPHAVDYICLLVAKRHALDLQVDLDGWKNVAESVVRRALALNHDHEVLWMLWLMVVLSIEVNGDMVDALLSSRNSHIGAFVVQAFVDGHLKRRPRLGLGSALSSVDSNWLTNLVARSQGYSKANFSGLFASEFSHLAERNIKLIDFEFHTNKIKNESRAISRTRYGYDDDSDDGSDEFFRMPGMIERPDLNDIFGN
ncbi:RNA-directed DNA polymerase [Mesorhizobium sp. M0047]|uniref:RNA-directed DNA polymerase n=1 Tax=Mesorhizobium sp. M0047 TaxID=2956859 RepID=UPI00333D435D